MCAHVHVHVHAGRGAGAGDRSGDLSRTLLLVVQKHLVPRVGEEHGSGKSSSVSSSGSGRKPGHFGI